MDSPLSTQHSALSTPPSALLVDPAKKFTFTFDGRPFTASSGQSIAAALYAAGIRVFSRSFKYHRPRGLFCVSGDCPNCLMQVDGRPNVRTCMEPAKEGQVVQHQNAWPGLGFDVLRVVDKLDRRFPVGFYYKRYYKPWVWRLVEPTIRKVAGLGRIDVRRVPEMETEVEHLHADVCVVGGGPAGLAAAVEASGAGASLLLVDRQPRLGGHLLFDGIELPEIEPLAEALRKDGKSRIVTGTTAFGLYEGNLLAAFQGNRLLKIRAKQIVVCTGGREHPFVFHNNDLPGVFLARGVQRLARLYGVLAGKRAVVFTDHDEGGRMAQELSELGIQIAAVVDPRPVSAKAQVGKGWETLFSNVILSAKGGPHLQAVQAAQVSLDGKIEQFTDLPCDLLCIASSLLPANELLLQRGARFRLKDGRWRPDPDGRVGGLSAAGAAAGTFNLAAQILEGRLRGAEAAAALGFTAKNLEKNQDEWIKFQALPIPPAYSSLMPKLDPHQRKRFICLCEDVTDKDVEQAVAEGFDGIETLKRYSTASMGPCQGKVCGQALTEACAKVIGREPASIGMTTSRPPAVPVELSVLAAGRHHPIRRTALHHWHETAGVHWMDAGQWKRPEFYVDPGAEVRLVRTNAGLIDVSTLGKFEITGPDAIELLERVYFNRWNDLKIGQVRYAAMCNEDGILFDDGVGGRLGGDRFYVTATTGNADAVFQWLELWKANWRLNVTIRNLTSAQAAMNLAGPRAWEILGRLTETDLSPAAFPYLSIDETEIAGVRCQVLRIGFVGELGYEIHCSSHHAWHLWEALLEADQGRGGPAHARERAEGLRPFGVEAQRILRLEKGHLIMGQDTDALSNPLEAGLGNLIAFEKPDFIGKKPLQRLKEMGPRSRLVGFILPSGWRGSRRAVPPEGCQVVDNGMPVGRVTSARFSPTLQQVLGLAWVPAARSKKGETFLIRANGSDMPAVVAALPFYDPEGKRQKS
jgi:sarcosine oxidase subunit alpha